MTARRLAFVILLACAAPCLIATSASAQPIALETTLLWYGPDPAQELALIRPADRSAGPLPTLLLAHGGLWQTGSHASLDPTCEAIVEASGGTLACASMSYRLSMDLGGMCAPEANRPDTYGEQVRDMASAMATLQHDASSHGLDPHRFFVGGHSAGGHLAQLLNLRFDAFAPPCPPGAICPPPIGAIGLEGIYDIRAWDAYDAAYWSGAFFCATRRAFGTGPQYEGPCYDATFTSDYCWDVGAPRFVAADAARFGAAPSGDVLLIHSPGDLAVDPAEATRFAATLASTFPTLDVRVFTDGSCGTGDHGAVVTEPALVQCVTDFVLEKSAAPSVPLSPWLSVCGTAVALAAAGVRRAREASAMAGASRPPRSVPQQPLRVAAVHEADERELHAVAEQ